MNSTDLIPTAAPALAPVLARYAEEHYEFLKARRAASTRRLYTSHWRHWHTWCAAHDLAATDPTPETVALYLRCRAEDPAGRIKPATVQVVLAAIEYHLNGHVRSVARPNL